MFNVGDIVRVTGWGGVWEGVEGPITRFEEGFYYVRDSSGKLKMEGGFTERNYVLVSPVEPEEPEDWLL